MNKTLKLADDILDVFSLVYGSKSMIAGGFPRDIYFGKTPKDIDIWIPSDVKIGNRESDLLKELFESRGMCLTIPTITESEDHYKIEEIGITRIVKCQVDGVDIDLISTKFLSEGMKGYSLLFNFDMGICQIARKGGEYIFTENFIDDKINKTITLYHKNRSLQLVNFSESEHLPRVKAKFPDYEIVRA